MCLFAFKNKTSGKALLKGIEEFECGHCPECLQKKSRKWALRCAMEAKVSPGVMVTLTYDTYKVINGKLSEYQENPINPNMQLSKRDCQLFIKRLRKHFEPLKIKYLLTAERGKKGRAHYHALIFGVQFNDLIKYKKSDRGNWIYKSKTLTDIWQNGICTVDCINLSAKTARYCTKYCAKDSGANETFMLFSRGIGDEKLLEEFNGKSYWVDGREYSIPKQIWQKVIEKRYNCKGYSKYVGKEHVELVEKSVYNQLEKIDKRYSIEKQTALYWDIVRRQRKCYNSFTQRRRNMIDKKSFELHKLMSTPVHCLKARVWHRARRRLEQSSQRYDEQAFKREIFEKYRDNDPQYLSYLEYWKEKNRVAEFTRPDVPQRILALPDNKYRSYKSAAIRCYALQHGHIISYETDLSDVVINAIREYSLKEQSKWVIKGNKIYRYACYQYPFIPPRSNCHAFLRSEDKIVKKIKEKSFAPLARHYRANDTNDFSAENKFFWTVQKILFEQKKEEKRQQFLNR